MNLAEILLIALGLAMDAFAVSLGAGATRFILGPRPVFRLAFHFGLFQALMPILGWSLGIGLERWVTAFDHWIAFGLLFLVGAHMLWEAIHGEEEQPKRTDITRGIPLLTLSIATSIDSLGVGLGLAFVESRVWLAALIVGCVCFLITAAGFYTGRRIGGWLGRWADALGGLVLIGIGARILITHFF